MSHHPPEAPYCSRSLGRSAPTKQAAQGRNDVAYSARCSLVLAARSAPRTRCQAELPTSPSLTSNYLRAPADWIRRDDDSDEIGWLSAHSKREKQSIINPIHLVQSTPAAYLSSQLIPLCALLLQGAHNATCRPREAPLTRSLAIVWRSSLLSERESHSVDLAAIDYRDCLSYQSNPHSLDSRRRRHRIILARSRFAWPKQPAL